MTEETNKPFGIALACILGLILAAGYISYTGYGITSETDQATVQFVREDSVGGISGTSTGRRAFRSGGTSFGK
jgi:hypothetical protein